MHTPVSPDLRLTHGSCLILRPKSVIVVCVSHEGYDFTKLWLMINPIMDILSNNVLLYEDFIAEQMP